MESPLAFAIARPAGLRRGITPDRLLSQVESAAPFLFSPDFPIGSDQPHLAELRRPAPAWGTHGGYFRLCLAAHHATVATFVPTDVDNQIRFHLWDPALPEETLAAMADSVEESFRWSNRGVSARSVPSPVGGPPLSGHLGEWFSTAAAAYGVFRRRDPERAARLRAAIEAEVERHRRVFLQYRAARDGRRLMEAAAVIAHNLGDLDRVIDLWNLPEDDPLRMSAYRRGHGERHPLAKAGALNRTYLAAENHRHLALREPRCLRRRPDLLLPIGPFLDDWGRTVARHPSLSPEEVGEVVQALVDGFERLKGTTGYARALAGILEAFPGGGSALRRQVPGRIARQMETGRLRALISIPQSRFEGHWARAALKLVQSS